MNRELAIGTAISLLLHTLIGLWGMTLVPQHRTLPPEARKLVKTVREQVMLPRKPDPPKPEPPKPEPKPEPTSKLPDAAAEPKLANKPKADTPKPQPQKPSEPAPLVLSKTYGASDGSGVAVNAGKEDTLGDPNVDPNADNTRQRFVPKVDAPAVVAEAGEDDESARKVEIVHAVSKSQCKVEWPEGAETSGRVLEVTLLLRIGLDGGIEKVSVLRGHGEPFDEAAMTWLRQCKFNPGTRDGKPFRDQIKYTVEFKPPR